MRSAGLGEEGIPSSNYGKYGYANTSSDQVKPAMADASSDWFKLAQAGSCQLIPVPTGSDWLKPVPTSSNSLNPDLAT
ncbi:hypothetical protein J0S82_015438 [Galemys pyrenaicus]|uniref:Uncharacterized protein n=1 Tax=Galemys pyrenaicus TaxID=202257 RepID=A0A8J6ASG9_GALPY|nr:hypothetical protein J0S82_015438 [Galemys pyrenaicus]